MLSGRSWDPAAKEHMTAYDMHLKNFNTMHDEEDILEGDEEVLPDENSYEFSLHFLASNK
jgi:hypothetical protein